MAVTEVRTQIYLHKSQHEALKRAAMMRSVSMAQIVREAIALYLGEMAVALHDLVAASEIIDEVEIDVKLRALGWEIFVGYTDKVLSFTDCMSFALMRERKLLEAFTFDFERAGFVVLHS